MPRPSEKQRIEELLRRLRGLGGAVAGPVGVVRSPLRVSPLGAHIDHQGGTVTGMAIDRSILLAFVPAAEGPVRVESLDFAGRVEIAVGEVPRHRVGDWADHLRGAVALLASEHPLERGMTAVVSGEMPIGGLSSSAAVTLAYLSALDRVNGLGLERRELLTLARRTENEYVGVASGILDQSVILHSERGHLTVIDCVDGRIEVVPRAAEAAPFGIMVVHSGVSRALVASGFNTRVDECREAARRLLVGAGREPGSPSRLCDVPFELFETEGWSLPPALRRRAEHYFAEMRRVGEGVAAWRVGDLERFGALVTESGASSIHTYEAGCEELTTLYEILRTAPGVYGARFNGGGFGGSCLALVDPTAQRPVAEAVRQAYIAAHPERAAGFSVHCCESADGLSLLEPEPS